MVERRNLIEGLKSTPPPIDPDREKGFVFGDKASRTPPSNPPAAVPVQAPIPSPTPVAHSLNRVPVSTRLREDYSKALKRASLERQLAGVEPNTLQDILEEALEPWLKRNGYVT